MSHARLRAAIVSVGVVLAASSGYAQEDPRVQGANACGPDAERLCEHVMDQGDMIMLKCFKNRSSKLSRSCHAFLKKAGQLK